jgi:hypothetical protein
MGRDWDCRVRDDGRAVMDTRYTVAFWGCGCIHMAIPTSHPHAEAWRASWEQMGYVVAEMDTAQITAAGRACVVHETGLSQEMQVRHAEDRQKIYGGGK